MSTPTTTPRDSHTEALDKLYRLSLRPGEPELLEWIADLIANADADQGGVA